MTLGLLLNTINSGVKLLTASLVLDVISGWDWPAALVHRQYQRALGRPSGHQNSDLDRLFTVSAVFAAGALFSLLYLLGEINKPLSDTLADLDAQAS